MVKLIKNCRIGKPWPEIRTGGRGIRMIFRVISDR